MFGAKSQGFCDASSVEEREGQGGKAEGLGVWNLDMGQRVSPL